MKYDFDRLISRKNTGCMKWDGAKALFGNTDVIPMWVADMDIPIAHPITEAMKERVEHNIFGYPVHHPESVMESIIYRMQKLYSWQILPEWIVFTPGIIPALYTSVRAFSRPGDDVILQGPVYHPFWSAIRDNGCHVSENRLLLNDSHYEIDFDDLKTKFGTRSGRPSAPSRARLLILCSPHNPVGRVWTEEELTKIGEIITGNGAIIVSDEVHSELLFRDARHTPIASLSEEFEQNSITCISPSKTFNLAGLYASAIIIPNARYRRKFQEARKGIVPGPNVFGLTAMEAAYKHGDEWLEQLLVYLNSNLEYLLDYFERRIPAIRVIKPEGTYLVWLDCRKLGFVPEDLKKFLTNDAEVGLDEGSLFGPGGAGFARMNIACPRSILTEALKRLESAVTRLKPL
ncbi:MAG: PatB family C-S lyase [Candidatus Scalinduaceae bacterium]